jgi:hypothetical protein
VLELPGHSIHFFFEIEMKISFSFCFNFHAYDPLNQEGKNVWLAGCHPLINQLI